MENNDSMMKSMEGKTFVTITGKKGDNEMVFTASDDSEYRFYHQQDCCESVSIGDITGDIEDLIGVPMVSAIEATNKASKNNGSQTWTFYNFSTSKGYVTVRWLGESNGYYSESVDIEYTHGRKK